MYLTLDGQCKKIAIDVDNLNNEEIGLLIKVLSNPIAIESKYTSDIGKYKYFITTTNVEIKIINEELIGIEDNNE